MRTLELNYKEKSILSEMPRSAAQVWQALNLGAPNSIRLQMALH